MAWVRKDEEELRRERIAREAARRSLRGPLVGASLLTAACLGLYALGVRGFIGGTVIASPQGIRSPLTFAAVGVAFFVASFFIFRRRQGTAGESPFATQSATICNRCHESSLEEAGGQCECGGTFEPLEHWKWVEITSEEGGD